MIAAQRRGVTRSVGRTAVRIHATAKPAAVQGRKEVKRALAAGVIAASPIAAVQAAYADDAVDQAVATATQAVQATGQYARSALGVLGNAAKAVQQGYEAAAPVVKQGVDAVAPVVQNAVKVTVDTAGPALKGAVPAVQDAVGGALRATGLDPSSVTSTTSNLAKTAADGAAAATPALSQAINFLTSKDPTTLAEYGVGAVAAYYLLPRILGVAFGSLRGYAGEVTAAAALDMVNSDSGAVLIDIRTAREKEQSGLPDVAGGARDRALEVEFAFTEDRRLRGQLRDASYIEAQVTALQIAALKRLNRGSRIVLLDKNGSAARAVAKELSKRGFSKVFLVAGGFDGRGGWVASKLLVKPSAAMYSSAPQSLAKTVSTRMASVAGRKSLPAPSK